MPRTVYLPRNGEGRNSGIEVTWTKTSRSLSISGWYDSFVGIEGETMKLREFFDALGITEKDCAQAWR